MKAMRTIKKKGLEEVAEENGVDLYSLPYRDVSENRLQWKASNPVRPPMPKNPRLSSVTHLCCSAVLRAALFTHDLRITLQGNEEPRAPCGVQKDASCSTVLLRQD